MKVARYKSFVGSLTLKVAVVLSVICSLASDALAQFPIYRPTQTAQILQNGFTHAVAADSLLICGLDDGLGFVSISDSSEVPRLFSLLSYYHEDRDFVSLELYDTVLIAHFGSGLFKFYDVSNPPMITTLGEAQYNNEFMDFCYRDGSMYFAEEFKGITQHALDGFSGFSFVDSTMAPIRTIQLELRGDTLFALDDYNGVLRIKNLESGLRDQLNYLWLPFQANGMTLDNSEFLFSEGESGFKTVTYDGSALDSEFVEHNSISYAYRTLQTDSNYIVISSTNIIEVISKSDPGNVQFISVSGNTQGACLAAIADTQLLISPSRLNGLAGYAMNLPNFPIEFAIYDHPGPITALEYIDGQLYTGGGKNPFETYVTSGGGDPQLLGERSYPPGIAAAAAVEDTLYLVDNSDGHGLLWSVHVSAGWLPTPLGTYSIPSGVDAIQIYHSGSGGRKNFLFRASGRYYLNQASFSEPFGISTPQLALGVGVKATAITLRTIFSYSSKGVFKVHHFNSSGTLTEVLSAPHPETINLILPLKQSRWVLLFVDGAVQVLDVGDPDEPVFRDRFALQGNYHTGREVDDLIFVGGANSIGILSQFAGEVFESAFLPVDADYIDGGDGAFFTSNGTSIRRFDYLSTDVGDDEIDIQLPEDYQLLSAYPNPFNATVNIAFSGASGGAESRIVLYNVLGQVVRELPISSEAEKAGLVRWDGRNAGGTVVASGMYLAKLVSAESDVQSGRLLKLILLK